MLEVSNLACVRGDNQLFEGLSFGLTEGEVLYVHGPNGSGKTTLLRAICGLVVPDEGDIVWGGEKTRKLAEDYHRHIAYFGHLNGLKDELTALENLTISAHLAGVRVTEEQISSVLAKLGVEICQELPTSVLSQGQKKRTALARFILNKSKLWILDEPFTALDVAAVAVLQDVIVHHAQQGGMVILTTHQEVALEGVHVRHIHLKH